MLLVILPRGKSYTVLQQLYRKIYEKSLLLLCQRLTSKCIFWYIDFPFIIN